MSCDVGEVTERLENELFIVMMLIFSTCPAELFVLTDVQAVAPHATPESEFNLNL